MVTGEGEVLLEREGLRFSPQTPPGGVNAEEFERLLTGAKAGDERMLIDGFYAEITLAYDSVIAQEKNGRPFGIEAQRILRLEKGHFIVGQDTDGLSQGFGFGLDKAIRLDKDDFAGKPELVWQTEGDVHPRLVAIQTDDPELVPLEACQIVDEDGTIRGRITSSRMSPTLGRSICLAQVEPGLDDPDSRLHIQLPNGKRATARVLDTHAHFDPEGSRARG